MNQRFYMFVGVGAVLALSVSASSQSLPSSPGKNDYRPAPGGAIAYQFENSGHGSYQGRNAAQRLTLEFTPQEARLQNPSASGSLRLTGYGYGGPLRPPHQAKLVSSGNRLEYQRGGLTEWYVNQPDGLEQGFTFARRPAGDRKGEPLVIALAVAGGLTPVLASGGDTVLFQSEGREVMRYGSLRTWDARGREVASRLEVREREIRLIVDDSDAQYPIVVDPITATTFTPAPGSPDPLFTTHPMSVVTADFRQIGKQDLAVASLSGFVDILLGNGDGTFALSSTFANSAPRAIATGDFNADGCPDLAVVNMNAGVTVLLNFKLVTCTGSFNVPPPPYPAGANPEAVAVGKFQGACPAGDNDIAVTNFGDATVSVLLNKCDGSGTFKPAVSIPVGQGPDGIVVGDFNEDLKLDLAVVNSIDGTVSILLGDGTGGFTLKPSGVIVLGPAGRTLNGAQVLATGLLNNDTHLDLAIAADLGVLVLLGHGDGTFGPPAIYPADQTPSSVGIGDFNGDTIADLAVSNAYSSDVSVLLGVGDGTFKPPVNFPTGLFPDSLAVGAFNTNNNPNLGVAVTSFTDANVTVLLGTLWKIAALSGSGQTAQTGTTFANPLVAQVTDATNAPVKGAQVTFIAPSSGASATLSPSPAPPTDVTGQTQVMATANSIAGTYTVTAMVGFGATANFTLTNKADPFIAATGGTPQTTKVGTVFPSQLQAKVTDDHGVGIALVPVTFTAPSAAGASGTFSGPTTVLTDPNGIAAITFTANGTAGSYVVTAFAAGIGTAFFALTNTASTTTGSPASIVTVGGTPQSTGLGSPFPAALTVRVTDGPLGSGSPVPGATVTFTLNPVAGAGGTFTGSTMVPTNGAGLATAPTLTANGTAGTFTVTASVPISAFPFVATATFTLTNLGGGGIILPSDQTLGLNDSVSFLIRLGSPAPAGGIIVTLTSDNTSVAQIIPQYIRIPEGSTTSLGMARLIAQGFTGSATITASAQAYGLPPVSFKVTVK